MRTTAHVLLTLALLAAGLCLVAAAIWAVQTPVGALAFGGLLVIALLDRLRVFWGWVRSTPAK